MQRKRGGTITSRKLKKYYICTEAKKCTKRLNRRLNPTAFKQEVNTWGQHYVPRYLCSPVPMFPEPMFPGTYVPRYLCSPVPMFPEPMFPGTYVPRYLCSPNLCSPVPMFPDLLQMCCRAYIRRPSDRHWNCMAAKRNISQNVKT